MIAFLKKKITAENIAKLTNLIENHIISELVDNCLAKNKKKIISILNENNFNTSSKHWWILPLIIATIAIVAILLK